jgi:NAD(P)-dependent dehydrogenase (short-subunit alcohol dehydrogenase family)
MTDGRVVVITGAASGMGAASARAFAAQGDTVVIVDRDGDGARTVAASIGAGESLVGDVSDSAFCDSTIERVVETHGGVDVLVNAAGTIHRANSLGTDDADWRRVMGVNVDGTYFMCRAAIEPMRVRGGGVIVNFGSIWGEVGAADVTAYCVSKGAVHQLTRALALDHVGDNIRVNAVAPGEVNTPMLASQREVPPTPADLQALADATIPMKRLAEPEEIASVVVFLASDDAGYMTGAIVPVDGGYTVR